MGEKRVLRDGMMLGPRQAVWVREIKSINDQESLYVRKRDSESGKYYFHCEMVWGWIKSTNSFRYN